MRPSPLRALTLLVAALLVVAFEPAAGLPTASAKELSTQEPYDLVAEYAEIFGVSYEAATSQLAWESAIGELEAVLEETRVSTFAGVFIDHEPSYRVVVLDTQPLHWADVSTLLPSDLEKYTEFQVVTRSLTELLANLDAIRSAEATTPFDIRVNVPDNQVELFVASRRTFETFLRAHEIALPESVVVVDVPTLASPSVDIYGGLNGVPDCTSGFSVNGPSGSRGVTFAAHCPDGLSVSGVALTLMGSAYYGSHDEQWHTKSGHTYPNWIKVISGHRDITAKLSRTNQVIGGAVCKWGRSAGYACGTIVSKTVAPGYIPNAAATTMQGHPYPEWPDMCSGGDSGGPVFIGNTAYGTITGCAGSNNHDDVMYIASNYIESGLGVTIRTSP